MYTCPGSYTRDCLAALRNKHGTEILAVHHAPKSETPFDQSPLAGVAACMPRNAFQTPGQLAETLLEWRPDAVYVSGWQDRGYLKAARLLKKRGVRVICGMDTQYTASVRQHLAAVASKSIFHSAFDVMWVPGARQALFARKLGYGGANLWSGYYTCDPGKFLTATPSHPELRDSFVFVGRYLHRKGLDILLEAYSRYRDISKGTPWDLVCLGSGPLEASLQGREGVRNLGFQQPGALPGLLASCGAFVLPSRREAWGVVVQEAAAAGLPLICSDAVGAADHLLREHLNGYVFASENTRELAALLKRVSQSPPETRKQMGAVSQQLSQQYSPDLWTQTLVDGLQSL